MKIVKYGHVIITEKRMTRIEDFLMQREDTDPVKATNDQLVAAAAVEWALKKLQKEYNDALLAGLIKTSSEKKAELAKKGEPN
jgi:hypothetical protein